MMLRSLDAGESHGKGVVTIIEGLPYGIVVSEADIARELQEQLASQLDRIHAMHIEMADTKAKKPNRRK